MSVGSVASPAVLPRTQLPRRFDGQAVCVWAVVGALVLYLAFRGGGYDLIVRNEIGVIVWWAVLVGAACGLLPGRRLIGRAWLGLGLLAGFLAWMAISWSSSHSPGRSLDEVSRVACYLGVLALAVAIHRDRRDAVRQTVNALAAAIVLVAAVAVLSRLRPGLFSHAQQTAAFLPGTRGRLAWPLNYWNALAALVAIGLPLLLAIMGSARTLAAQAAAAAGVPVLALCAYLTFSRGGAIETAGGLLVYFAFTDERLPKLASGLAAAAASAVAIVGAVHGNAIENGLTGAVARHQGLRELAVLVVVSAAAATIQVGIGLAARHGTAPAGLRFTRQRAQVLLALVLAAVIAVGLAAGVPSKLSKAWRDFKRPSAPALTQNTLARFGSASGNQRYDYWKVAVNASSGHLLTGWGPGTYQFIWLSRAPYYSYVQNAHSLYLETLTEDGVIGLGLVLGFFVTVTLAALRLAVRSRERERVRAAGIAGACVAFMLGAAFDWVWQVPVLPVVFMLLAGAVLAAPDRSRRGEGPAAAPAPAAESPARRLPPLRALAGRVAGVAIALVLLAVIIVPLETASSVKASQTAAARGDSATALRDALEAAKLEPGTGAPQLQLALVYEARNEFGPALQAAARATADDPLNWASWLTYSRIEAEAGLAHSALADFERARSLNPHSPVFAR